MFSSSLFNKTYGPYSLFGYLPPPPLQARYSVPLPSPSPLSRPAFEVAGGMMLAEQYGAIVKFTVPFWYDKRKRMER